MSLEELEKKLYGLDRKEDSDQREPVQRERYEKQPEVQTSWEKEDELIKEEGQEKKIGTGLKVAFWGGLVLLLAVGGAAYYYIAQYYKTKDLAFDARTVDKVLIARPFDVTVDIENKSQAVLRQGRIFVSLPDGVIEVGNETDKQTIEEEVGDLAAGETVEKKYTLVIVKDEQSTKKIDVNFSYLPQNINTRFEREKTLEVNVDQSAIALNFTTPQKVFSTENFDMGIQYRNISDIEFTNAKIKLITPQGFIYKDASMKPELGNASWIIASSTPQAENTITVKGALEGTDQSVFEIKAQVVAMLNGKEYVINEKAANVSIASSPLSLEIVANNSPRYIAKPGDQVSYILKYRNNTEVALSDAIIKAKLKGEMFDLTSLKTKGSFDSVANTLTWSAASNPELKLIAPGVEGTVDFTIQAKGNYPIKRMFDKNYTLQVNGEINSPTVPYNVASDRTVGFATNEIKVGGDISIVGSIDRAKGSGPLQVNKATRYTVTWTIRNYSTDMTGIKVSSGLEPGVKWTGVVKSNSGADPVYNDRTGELEWTIDKIIATKGAIGLPTEATFQVEVTPNVTQSGNIPLVKDLTLTATDGFTGEVLTRQLKGLQTPEAVVR